ncbi:uncharacterized protein PV09_08462 [Verruconis gallopava]|uniref:CID domain-containing protein n=1 Tax=Verruconis gallopava TaxID=253628 RepID=A0A0D1XCD3_9PEZI|nr:uncharacterized protein PV09_08462 [Verruconis gallopava]KIV99945.1 hypothetical protein PV09_08462 [Verruconis gallopava]
MSYPADEPPELVLAFREALEDLQRNDQYEIENLRVIAKEATEHAQAISQEVETHIRKTRPEYKLPGLYLLDSLVKHIGTPYTVYLSRNLYRTFFDAYTVVDNNTRRAMEELFRSWLQPVPESRDPRPVFPPEVTQPIEAALSKMRGIDQRSREAVHGSQSQKMNAVPPHVTNIAQPGRTPTPTGQYGYQPPSQVSPQGFPGIQNIPYQSHPPPYGAPVRSPVPQNVASSLQPGSMGINQSFQPPSLPQNVNSVNYVYSGPPPPTMSHQARLEKLRYDVQGLLDSVRVHLAHYPHDQEKLKLQQNLQSLKSLLDNGSLSLTHIQSTEIVVANIARDLPFRPPTATVPTPTPAPAPAPAPAPTPQPQPTLNLNPSVIASILALGTPQQTPHQAVQPQAYVPPPVTSTMPYSAAYPATAPSHPTSGLPVAAVNSAMSQIKPNVPSPAAGPPPPAVVPASALSILDQLRASGILGSMSAQSTPVQVPAASSILSQLMQPQAGAQGMNDVRLEANSLKLPRPHLIRQLYEDKPDQCRQCGMRFPDTAQGKKAKGVHIDWHFQINTRVQESKQGAVNRSWYIDERDWISYREELSGYSGIVTESTSGLRKNAAKKEVKEAFVFVPTDARYVNLPCSICQEKFEQGWDEETQQPTWRDAVKMGSKYYHASCYAEVTKGAAAATAAALASVGMERTASSSARSTPDPVLGKRRFDDFRLDAAAT